MDNTIEWAKWVVKQNTPESDNPLIRDEAFARTKAVFKRVQDREIRWDVAIAKLGKTQGGSYYIFINNYFEEGVKVIFVASPDRPDANGLMVRVGEGMSAEYFRRLTAGSPVKLKGRVLIDFQDNNSIVIVVEYSSIEEKRPK